MCQRNPPRRGLRIVRHLIRATGVTAIAHQLDRCSSIMTIRAAIFLAACDLTVACRVRAFSGFGHVSVPCS
jgi:hypothetical protein